MAVIDSDPRPVLRKELARVFQNQRVIRAFEKIFDLIPPEFIDQQTQIDALVLISEVSSAQSNAVASAIQQLTEAVERLLVAPAPPSSQVSDLINLTSYPALDTTITVSWSGQHAFTLNGTLAPNGSSVLIAAAPPYFELQNTSGALDSKRWINNATSTTYQRFATDDAGTTAKLYESVVRAANVISSMAWGNTTDNPTYTFRGTSTPTHGGSQLIQTSAALTNNAAAAAGTLLNAPIAGNPTKWIPINDNGTIRNIPAW